MSDAILDRLIIITRDFRAHEQGADDPEVVVPEAAICQDLMIFGVAVEDYVWALERDFGAIVWEVPWLRFTDQTSSFRGWGCLLFPFWLSWRLLYAPVAGERLVPVPNPREHRERLTLRHLAAVFETGEWFEPAQGS